MRRSAVQLSRYLSGDDPTSPDYGEPDDDAAPTDVASSPQEPTASSGDPDVAELREELMNHRLDSAGQRVSAPTASTGSESVIMTSCVIAKPSPPLPPQSEAGKAQPPLPANHEPLPPLPPPKSPLASSAQVETPPNPPLPPP